MKLKSDIREDSCRYLENPLWSAFFRLGNGNQISIFFDMADTGMANMDMEFIKYLIGLFKMYYPDFLNYILVFEMPWILNGK